jgi:hypothetical protein
VDSTTRAESAGIGSTIKAWCARRAPARGGHGSFHLLRQGVNRGNSPGRLQRLVTQRMPDAGLGSVPGDPPGRVVW